MKTAQRKAIVKFSLTGPSKANAQHILKKEKFANQITNVRLLIFVGMKMLLMLLWTQKLQNVCQNTNKKMAPTSGGFKKQKM
jgi:hypothetical protein